MDRTLIKAAQLFGFHPNEAVPLSGGFRNSVYEYGTEDHRFILRITDAARRNKKEIDSELKWIECLHNNGLSVSRPVKSLNDRFIEQTEESFLVSFMKADGAPVNVSSPEQWNPDFFREWGRYTGKMHAISRNGETFIKNLNRQAWNRNHPDILNIERNIPSREIQQKYRSLLTNIWDFKLDNSTYGFIHNDFHQGNFFVHDGKITAFDFDDCAFSWFANDIAVSFYHAFWQGMSVRPDHVEFGTEFIEHFLEGYSKEMQLTKDIIKQIPVFLKMRELFLYALFLQNWDLEHLEDWQAYTLTNLKESIEKELPYSNVDFAKL
ncbi:phosphotransferase enzyme family protein [Bacillus sp. T33-2]|uniref:phosphotransferase enzyme family protein n=1 Tax=Bacillus sp. T33-2 TaxID=2054168 RepID=UPI0015E06BD1|nr:phosphotransferase [Bacillus sp. T33-2]